MARILALDYGGKRTGVAVTDTMQIIATGLTTIESKTAIDWLKKYFETEPVEKVVIGLPKNLNNTDTDGTALVLKFIELFTKTFPDMPIATLDERFTSKMAKQTMIDSGLKKMARRDKALVDEISATIILQDYMMTL